MGADTPRGRDFDALWQYASFRHAFRLFTIVWGVAYLAEAAARIVIVETTSTATALTVSKVMPYAVAAILALWMTAYGRRVKRAGERMAEAQAQAQDEPEAAPAEPPVPETAGIPPRPADRPGPLTHAQAR